MLTSNLPTDWRCFEHTSITIMQKSIERYYITIRLKYSIKFVKLSKRNENLQVILLYRRRQAKQTKINKYIHITAFLFLLANKAL